MGPTGYYAQKKQIFQLTRMQENYENLLDLKNRLEAVKQDYENNEETIILEARKIGFFRPNDGLIVVRGLDDASESWEVGRIAYYQNERISLMRWYGWFAFIVGFCLVLIVQFFLSHSVNDENEEIIHGL